MRNRAGGFSLIELLLVLAIIAALAVAAFIVYPRVQAGRTAAHQAQILTAAQANIWALFPTNNYRNLNKAVAYNAGIFPDYMNLSATSIQNQWGGELLITPATPHAAGEAMSATVVRYFRIVYPNVPTDVCIRMVGALANNFGTIRVSANNSEDGGGNRVQDLYSEEKVEFNEANVALYCKPTAGNSAVTIILGSK